MNERDPNINSAWVCWRSLTDVQQLLLCMIVESGGCLQQDPNNSTRFYIQIDEKSVVGARRPSVSALVGYDLLAWDDNAATPESKAVLTERGLFVVKYGRGQG